MVDENVIEPSFFLSLISSYVMVDVMLPLSSHVFLARLQKSKSLIKLLKIERNVWFVVESAYIVIKLCYESDNRMNVIYKERDMTPTIEGWCE